ncbi:unnamed protein product [Prorocentrum cordatum]|uniref:EF-hand domain-containing protein n=1 Tax=Prorocentrum cordatum TaxID=2364126 RepID=A0ABN9WF28_9DINO|nr:unnamed protein product [Polarella glacialis]
MAFFREAALGPAAVAADVSCGTGWMARRLAASGAFARVFASDYSGAMLEEAVRTARREGALDGLRFLRADTQALPFRAGSLDCVHFGAALHCVPDAGAALRSVWRCLRPGGRLYATTFLRPLPDVVFRFFEPRELESLVAAAGFVDVEVEASGVYGVARAAKPLDPAGGAASGVRRALLQLLVQELPSEETRDLRADFLALDRSNTGTIALCDLQDFLSTKDLASGEMSVQSPRSGDLSDIMAALDMNGDGQVYFSEFLAATVRPEQHAHEDAMQAAFVRLDADGSGTIDAYDLACVFGESFEGADVEELLAQADATGVGEIDYDAFVAVLLRGGGAEEDALAAPPAASTSSPRSPPATPSSASSGEVSPRSPGRSSMPSSSLGELASPAKPEDVFLEEVLSPGPKLLGGMQVGVKSPLPAVCLVDKGFPEKVLWRMPQSPLGGS